MADRLWCPTRGYFEIGAGGSAPAESAAPASDASSEEAASAEPTAAAAAPAAATGGGSKVWAPTRGYFTCGAGGGAPTASAAAPKKSAPAAAKKPAAAAKPAAAKPAAAKAAKPKPAAAKKAAASAAPAAKAPEIDPERDSVRTVETLTGSTIGASAGSHLFDEPDSETTLYKVTSLNVAFFILSILLLVYTVAIMWKDYNRPWKQIQSNWEGELEKKYGAELVEAEASVQKTLGDLEPKLESILASIAPDSAADILASASGSGLDRFEALLADTEEALETSNSDYADLKRELVEKTTAFSLAEKQLKVDRGKAVAERFKFEEEKRSILDKHRETPKGEEAIRRTDRQFAEQWSIKIEADQRRVEELKNAADAAAAVVAKQRTELTGADGRSLADLETELAALDFEVKQVRQRFNLVATNFANVTRNLPILDMLAPSYTIQKVVTPDLHEDLQLLTMPRIDRCQTCHINIDNPAPEVVDFQSDDWGSVYASHPRLDLFVGSASPHPYGEFGCTVCHAGDGHATDFTRASHTPNSEAQREEWEEKYHWHKMHHQDWPMFESKYVTSSCGKCHSEEHRLEGGGNWNRGYELVKTYGCFGCHKIENFEAEPKVGPHLAHLTAKTDAKFVYQQIRNPQQFRPSARMPRFFDLTNSGGHYDAADPAAAGGGEMLVQRSGGQLESIDFHSRNTVEAFAIATYIAETSLPLALTYQLDPALQGDPKAGREVFRTSGCLGCHSVKSESMTPELGGTEESLMALVDAAKEQLVGLGAEFPTTERVLAEKAEAERASVHDAPDQKSLATKALAALLDLVEFYERLPVGEKVVEQHRRVIMPTLEIEKAGADVAAVKQAITAIQNRWIHNTRAPDLSGLGSKITSAAWLADWIVNPRAHDPNTIMPRLRLEDDPGGDQKVADLVAYLMALKDPGFAALPPFSMNAESTAQLDDLVHNYLKSESAVGRTRANQKLEKMSAEQKLLFAGQRLIRRYGCFACHDGISDAQFDFTGEEVAIDIKGSMDAAQRIGAELNGWGSKLPDRLDYGLWGHQHSGREAIPHGNRYAWIEAKLSDTRRFDVIPAEQEVDDDVYTYAVTRQLVQKTPEELLKMPLFAFHDDPDQVEAVATFIVGLVNDPVQPAKKRKLTGDAKILEEGARIIEKLNCQGCHRIGAEDQFVPLDELPTFSLYEDREDVVAMFELEKETWLNREVTLSAKAKAGASGLKLPFGTLLNKEVYDHSTMSLDDDDDSDDEPISVVELAIRDAEARGVPKHALHSQRLPVAGYHEGEIRFYFGTDVTQRAYAPPPLVRQGERVRSRWLFDFLLDVDTIRPWLKVKMPSFHLSPEDSRKIVRWFKVRSGLPFDGEVFDADRDDAAAVQRGYELFAKSDKVPGGLSCNGCHPSGDVLPIYPTFEPAEAFDWQQFKFSIPDSSDYVVWSENGEFRHQEGFESVAAAKAWAEENVPAGAKWAVGKRWEKDTWGPDLALAAERLRPDWVGDWLGSPPDFMPGTKMPNFFSTRDAMAKPGEVEFPSAENKEKIDALIRYLMHMHAFNAAKEDEN